MDYPITPDDEFRANFLEEKLKKSQDIAQSLADALEEAKSVISSINSGKQHKVELEDDVAYWQRGEWCEWAKNDVLPKIEAAIANYRKGE